MLSKIAQVVPNNNYTVRVCFDDGKIVLYDVSPLLEKETFCPLKDMEIFMNTCTILNDTLASSLILKWIILYNSLFQREYLKGKRLNVS